MAFYKDKNNELHFIDSNNIELPDHFEEISHDEVAAQTANILLNQQAELDANKITPTAAELMSKLRDIQSKIEALSK